MKVKELAQEIEICTFEDNLKRIAEIMRRHDSDVVPLADQKQKIVGVITRDAVCQAVAEFDRKPSAVKAAALSPEKILICKPPEKFGRILRNLVKKRLKYAAFTSQNGKTIAIISLPKILSRADDERKLLKKVFSAMEKISKPLPLVLSEAGFIPRNK